jgi:glycine dehydrogenase subunit 2
VLSEALAPYTPVPYVVHGKDGFDLVEHDTPNGPSGGKAFGRLKGFHGQMGMFVRALAYMMSHGSDGLRQASGDAVLNANYILAGLKDELTPAFPGTCMHEALFNDSFLDGTGVTTLDFAKAMIDEGYHPMTMYFPLVVHGALLMEPTETESRDGLDRYIESLKGLAKRAKAGDAAYFQGCPYHTPRRRLDETLAARHPHLRWKPEEPKMAAE